MRILFLGDVVGRAARESVVKRMPDIRRDKFEANVILDKGEFARQAIARQSPFITADANASNELPNDLRIAIAQSVHRKSNIVRDQKERLAQLRQLTVRLEPLRASLDACKCDTAMQIASKFNVAWTAAIIDAMQCTTAKNCYHIAISDRRLLSGAIRCYQVLYIAIKADSTCYPSAIA